MTSATILVRALRDPASATALDAAGWTALLTVARAESLIGTLAHRLADIPLPPAVSPTLADARASAETVGRQALWEAEMARRALAPLGVPVILLKGTAFAAAGLDPSIGRSIGDLDILVPREAIDQVESALKAAGWEWVKDVAYDDAYYRRWMHELPPLIHKDRDRMIDVQHTILPMTARQTPDAGALVSASIALPDGLRILAPADMIVHAACHLFADGDLAGGLRNLWDVDRLLRQFGNDPGFWSTLAERAALHEMERSVHLAMRLSAHLYGTPILQGAPRLTLFERLIVRRIQARDGWGRAPHPFTRLGFYIRSHWLRMPPTMLARHLWTKLRKR